MRTSAMWAGLLAASLITAAEPTNGSAKVQMLVPGFTVQVLPVPLPNVRALRFAPDGRFFALGQDGRIYLLRDIDGDGLEDRAEVFWEQATNAQATSQVPPAIWPAAEGVYLATPASISLLTDTNRDGRADEAKLIQRLGVKGMVSGLTRDAESNLFFSVHPGGEAGTNLRQVLKLAPDGSLTTFATGLRRAGTLRFNRAGDLFLTDPAGDGRGGGDKLQHIVEGKNYGSSALAPSPVVDFGSMPHDIGGLVWDESAPGQAVFGPAWWEGDALVAGAARGKIWRIRLVKTAHGYIGREYPIASVNRAAADLAISPSGALYLSTSDGDGVRLFKIAYTDRAVPQPVLAASFHARGALAYFDRELDDSATNSWAGTSLEYGQDVRAGDRGELIPKSGLAPRGQLSATRAKLSTDRRALLLLSEPYPEPATYAFALSGLTAAGSAPARVEMAFDHAGVEATWMVRSAGISGGELVWLPHLDLSASVEWMRGTCVPDILRRWVETGLTNEFMPRLELTTNLKFPPGEHTIHFEAEVKFSVTGEFVDPSGTAKQATNRIWISQTTAGESNRLDLSWRAEADHGQELKLTFSRLSRAALPKLEVYYTSAGDARPRAIPAAWLGNPPGRPQRR